MEGYRYRLALTVASRPGDPALFRGSLRGITVDAHGHLYAAGDSEVKVFGPEGGLQRRWATAGPAHIAALAPDGRVFVGGSRQIEIFDRTGRLLDAWRDPQRLGRVSAIGFANGGVLAGDSHGRAIRRYDAGGRFLNDIGRDNRTGGFVIPNGVLDFAVDAGGIIHAANPGKHRIERYTVEGTLLGHIGRFGGPDPAGFSGCCNPTNLCLGYGSPARLRDGRDGSAAAVRANASGASPDRLRIYTTEKAGPRVKVHDATGALLGLVADTGFDPNCKNMGIAVDTRGRVYVVDTVRRDVRVFEPEVAA